MEERSGPPEFGEFGGEVSDDGGAAKALSIGRDQKHLFHQLIEGEIGAELGDSGVVE